jgi:hypothetical protein
LMQQPTFFSPPLSFFLPPPSPLPHYNCLSHETDMVFIGPETNISLLQNSINIDLQCLHILNKWKNAASILCHNCKVCAPQRSCKKCAYLSTKFAELNPVKFPTLPQFLLICSRTVTLPPPESLCSLGYRHLDHEDIFAPTFNPHNKDLKVCDDDISVQLLTLRTLSIILFLFKTMFQKLDCSSICNRMMDNVQKGNNHIQPSSSNCSVLFVLQEFTMYQNMNKMSFVLKYHILFLPQQNKK